MSDPKPTVLHKWFRPGHNTTINCFGGILSFATFDFNDKSTNQPIKTMVSSEFMDILHGQCRKILQGEMNEASIVSSRRIPENNTWVPNLVVSISKGNGEKPYSISINYPESKKSFDYGFEAGATAAITSPNTTDAQVAELLFQAFVNKISPSSVIAAINESAGRALTKEERAAKQTKSKPTPPVPPPPEPTTPDGDIPY